MLENILQNYFKDNKDKLKELGFAVGDQYPLVQCPHCGSYIRTRGLGAHANSGRCIALRQSLFATLNGYIRTPIEWNKYTSPFQKRFWTNYTEGEGRKGRTKRKGVLRRQAWVEKWFAELWQRCCDPSARRVDKKPQKPKAEYESFFADMAKHRRNGATKKLEVTVGMLELALEKN